MKKDNVELICSIGELSNLFQEHSGYKGFLNQVVVTVARHMKADVCSIYLYEENNKNLILEATEGLNRELIGSLTLSIKEGLVGLALTKQEAVLEADGKNNPHFKAVPGSFEDQYEAFLAVPIIRGLSRIGVIVLQHHEYNYFDDNDKMALIAIASQLASALENAKLLRALSSESNIVKQVHHEGTPEMINGKKIVEGIAVGSLFVMEGAGNDPFLLASCDENCFGNTLENFEEAISKTEEQLQQLQNEMDDQFSDIASLIFSAHLLMLNDTSFSGKMKDMIINGAGTSEAVITVVNDFITIFSRSENPRLKEKVQDLKDLGHRILRNLSSQENKAGDYSGQIVIAGDLLPSELLKITAQHAEGLVLYGTGATAHISILARSLGVPLIITDNERIFSLDETSFAILDAGQGNLFINPTEDTILQYRKLQEDTQLIDEVADRVKAETLTRDGKKIRLLASINLLSDLTIARKLKAEGIGLYRSEFPFLIRNDFPTEEEQYRVYRKVATGLDSGPIILRTLDIGGDKILSYMTEKQEDNPFLGLRAIRFLLKNKKIFVGQLKAMLRAGFDREIRIMFPLISSVDDFRETRKIVEKSIGFLERDGAVFNRSPKLGVMIELPSAVELAEELAQEADFISIGTNDLVQYMLGVDRTNDDVSSYYEAYHPAVLRAISRIADACQKHECPLSVCGNLASDPKMVRFFIGLGISRFSVAPSAIPDLQNVIESIQTEKAKKDSQELLALKTIKEVHSFLKIK